MESSLDRSYIEKWIRSEPQEEETGVAVYLAFSDESAVGDQNGTFLMGGYVASEKEWPGFVTAWQERVLAGPPQIPYLHMREIRDISWRQQHRISFNDAEERVSEAVRVIFSSGFISAIGSHVRRDDLTQTMSKSIQGVGNNEPDYLCYIAYASFLLSYVGRRYPEAEKVNFIASKKNKVTHHISSFHKNLKSLIGPPLDSLVGDLLPGAMQSQLPLQAADVLCWHMQRYFAQKMNRVDESRLWCLGETSGVLHPITCDDLMQIAANCR